MTKPEQELMSLCHSARNAIQVIRSHMETIAKRRSEIQVLEGQIFKRIGDVEETVSEVVKNIKGT